MKKEILEEINRMRVLGGILNEAPNPTSIIPMLIAKFARTSLDDTILTAFESLEKRGVITIDNAAKTLTKVDWVRLTDDELKLLFSAKPIRDAFEDVIRTSGINTTNAASRSTFKGIFKRALTAYESAAGKSLPNGNNSLVQPSPSPYRPSNDVNLNPDASTRQAMDNSIAQTAKTNPNALAYYDTIDTFGMSDRVTRAMKNQYSKIGSMPTSKLLVEAMELSKKLDRKNFGWLLNIRDKIVDNPTRSITIAGKSVLLLVVFRVLINVAIDAGVLVLTAKDKIMKFFGMGDGTQQNTNTETPSGGASKYN